MRIKLLLFSLLGITIGFSGVNGQVEEAIIIGKVAVEAYGYIKMIYDYYNKGKNFLNSLNPELGEQFNVTASYFSLKNDLNEIKSKLNNITTEDSDVTNMKSRMFDLDRHCEAIDSRYQEFLKYRSKGSEYEEFTRKEYADEVLNENVGLLVKLDEVHGNVVGMGKGSLVYIIDKYIEYLSPYCDRRESRQRYFYYLFLSVMSHEIKGFLAMQYAYELKKRFYQAEFKQEIRDMTDLANKRMSTTVEKFKEVMAKSEPDLWRCDPKKHVENETYVELKNLFQRVFYYAREFTDEWDSINCVGECPVTKKSENLAPKCPGSRDSCLIPQRHCSNVVGCSAISTEEYDVCISKEQKVGSPRYSFVKTSLRTFFYHNRGCDTKQKEISTYYLGAGTTIVGQKCEACKCICDESEGSDRYISLRPVAADIAKNFVVTGVQFKLDNHTLYIKIQQGQLLPLAFINNETVEWKSLDSPSYDDDYDIDAVQIINLEGPETTHPKYQTNFTLPEIEEDKFKLEWYHRRGLYLDDIHFKKNEVVTGLRFAIDRQGEDAFVHLDLLATPFDFTTGKLEIENSYWWSTFHEQPNRTKLELWNKDSPLKIERENVPDKIPHQQTEFAPSDLVSKDGGQTTMPLIDIQPVFSDLAVPLSGISLDIKRNNETAGFLTLKVKTYDILWHLD